MEPTDHLTVLLRLRKNLNCFYVTFLILSGFDLLNKFASVGEISYDQGPLKDNELIPDLLQTKIIVLMKNNSRKNGDLTKIPAERETQAEGRGHGLSVAAIEVRRGKAATTDDGGSALECGANELLRIGRPTEECLPEMDTRRRVTLCLIVPLPPVLLLLISSTEANGLI